MAYSEGDLRREVHAVIEEHIGTGKVVRRSWVAHTIIMRHPFPKDGDDFHRLCAMKAVNDTVSEVLHDMKSRDTEDPAHISGAGTLPGFKHLCRAYSIQRRSDIVLVPIGMMTNSELRARANLYFAMAEGCHAHGIELLRFADVRRAS
jgi:hypothetical protein